MLIVCFRVGVTCNAGKFSVIRRVGMAVHAGIPFPVVFATVNWEILRVVVKSGRCPGGFGMASGTIRRELERYVVWVGR